MKFQFEVLDGQDCREKLSECLGGQYSEEELADCSIEQLAMEYLVSEVSSNFEYEDIPLTLIDAKIVNDFEVLDKPYSAEEVEQFKDKDGRINGVIAIDFNIVMRASMNAGDFLNDYIEELLIGDGYLSDIEYNIVGISDTECNVMYVKVSGIVENLD